MTIEDQIRDEKIQYDINQKVCSCDVEVYGRM